MKRPVVFLSSTCYDLKQVRVDLMGFVKNLGLEPALSDVGTFPVDPDLQTVENCIKVVQNKADIFVLVIGGRYGSSVGRDKSVTNIEFLTARQKGIPIYPLLVTPYGKCSLFGRRIPRQIFLRL